MTFEEFAAARLRAVLRFAAVLTGDLGLAEDVVQEVLPSAQAVGRSMLTAYSTADGTVLYTTQTGFNRGVLVDVSQDWSWPAQPVTGQREIWRERVAARAGRDKPLLLSEDDSFDYTATSSSTYKTRGTLTVVCYPTPGSRGGCGYNDTNTPAGTWSQHVGLFPDRHPELGDPSPSSLAHEIAKGQWRVTRRAWLNGQRAILLTETAKGSYEPLPTLLWVNERTFLPLRMINGQGRKMWAQEDWHFLAPTKQNLANLHVTIPPGYHRSAG